MERAVSTFYFVGCDDTTVVYNKIKTSRNTYGCCSMSLALSLSISCSLYVYLLQIALGKCVVNFMESMRSHKVALCSIYNNIEYFVCFHAIHREVTMAQYNIFHKKIFLFFFSSLFCLLLLL